MASRRQDSDYVQLREAVKKGNKARARNLILNNASVNIPHARGGTPLHWAITQFRDLDIMKMLLDRGANVHAKNHKRDKPLEVAIQHNKTEAAILLIQKGALVGEDLNVLLLKIIQKNNYTIFKSSVDHRTQCNQNINFDVLFKAAVSRGHPKIIEKIIPHCRFLKPSEQNIPRDFVIKPQFTNCVKLLLQRNFTISPNSDRDSDFVYGAVENGHLSIVLQLLKYGINVNMVNSTSRLSLLKAACLNKHHEIAENLLKHNACVNATVPTDTRVLKNKCHSMSHHNDSLSSMYNKTDLQGITCLHIAVLNSDPIMTKLLLKYGAKIIDDPKFFVITCIAVQINCEEIVRIFLKRGVNVNDIDAQGKSLLYFCVNTSGIKDSRYNIAKLLLEKGATIHIQTPGNMLFFEAVKNGYRQTAQLFLDYNADIQYISPDGDTPLHKAIENDFDVEFIQTLLKLNSPVDAVNNQMLTPLLVACKTQSSKLLEVIGVLLHWNANVNYTINKANTNHTVYSADLSSWLNYRGYLTGTNYIGQTPLHFVCKHKNDMIARTIQLLLKHGANIEAADARGWTPLFEACYSRNDVAVKCLLDNNANANHTDLENLTLLYIAAQYCSNSYDDPGIIKILLEHKVNVHCMNKQGKSVIHIIVEHCNAKLIKNLAHTQINFNSVNKEGNTPLHYAAQQECVDVTRNLIKYGANVNILSKRNRTPLQDSVEYMSGFQKQYEKFRYRQLRGKRNSDDEGWDTDTFEDHINSHKKVIKILKIQIVKLKTAGLKVNKQNLMLVYNTDDYSNDESSDEDDMEYKINVLQLEGKCEQEIEKMRMENIGVNNMTFYDILKKNIHILSRFVKNKKIKQILGLEVYDEKFPLYIDIIRSRFRDAKLRYRLMNSAEQYFSLNICQRLPDDCVDSVFSYLNIKEIKMFIRAMKPLKG